VSEQIELPPAMSTTLPPNSGRERRASTRVPVCLPVTVFGPTAIHTGTCMSVSTGGATLLLDLEVELGQIFELEIQLPTGPVAATAEVVNPRPERPGEFGVRFDRLEAEALFALHAVIAAWE